MGDVRSPRAATIVAPMLAEYCAVLDAWKFSGESEGQYALALSAISSAWRSPGVAKKIYHSVASRFSEQVANDVARKVPCRVIQTRWGSVKNIEKIVSAGHLHLASSFEDVFPIVQRSLSGSQAVSSLTQRCSSSGVLHTEREGRLDREDRASSLSPSQVCAQKRLFVTIASVRSLWMCDTQKVEVPPSLNAMEGTGSEAREREAAGGRQGKEGKSMKGNKVQGLVASQFSSFHRACVSSVGCSNAGSSCAFHPKASCERKAVHQNAERYQA